jgi:hypothetical protein
VTRELREKSDEELRFHLEHNGWPADHELLSIENEQTP